MDCNDVKLKVVDGEKLLKELHQVATRRIIDTKWLAENIEYVIDNNLWQYRDPAPGKLGPRVFKSFSEFVQAGKPFGLSADWHNLTKALQPYAVVYAKLAKANLKRHLDEDEKTIYEVKLPHILNNSSMKNANELLNSNLIVDVAKGKMTQIEALREAGRAVGRKKYCLEADPVKWANKAKEVFNDHEIKRLIVMLKD